TDHVHEVAGEPHVSSLLSRRDSALEMLAPGPLPLDLALQPAQVLSHQAKETLDLLLSKALAGDGETPRRDLGGLQRGGFEFGGRHDHHLEACLSASTELTVAPAAPGSRILRPARAPPHGAELPRRPPPRLGSVRGRA